MAFARLVKHLAFGSRAARRLFPPGALDRIQQAIAAGERHHAGQVCFAIEGSLPVAAILRGESARERAREMFARLHVWNTRNGSGVLIYLLVADRAIEIFADRGIAARVGDAQWQAICAAMREHFRRGDFLAGAIDGVQRVSDLLAAHFPFEGTDKDNELPDRPVMI